jgi:hypothetical protein
VRLSAASPNVSFLFCSDLTDLLYSTFMLPFVLPVTIGMLVESMAGKAGACHAAFQDSTPFRFCEGQRAVDYFGEQVSREFVS